ncbi:SGNH/GDSL hydrolase family protein [Kribbella sp. NPDC056951]|uniref:SGNH/GDSL hydrolase family protein n=1 Tax=Kribbella sp. NPDC056951 TaxID=3345978 RepID=UPI0036334239
MRIHRLTVPLLATGILAALSAPTTATATDRAARTDRWTGTWASAVQRPMGATWQGANWSLDGFANSSLRQVVRISAGGSQLRVRLSNRYGTGPLQLTGATVAKAGPGASTVPGTTRNLTFRHLAAVAVPAGQDAVSDATALRTTALERLTITLYFATPTGPATFHESAAATTYRASGDHRTDPSAGAFRDESHSSYYLTGVDVAGTSTRSAVVAFGDSITDGVSSTRNANNRYPDQLAERVAASGRRLSVVNAGLSGNRLLADSDCCGVSALHRFRHDVLSQPGVRTVIVSQGLNDLGFNPDVTAAQLIAGHRQLITAAHRYGVRIVGGTITPMKGSMLDSARGELVRQQVNQWIRTSGEYDAVVDFAAVLADPADPTALRSSYDAGDSLHPNDAGLAALAAAIDLSSL